MPSLLAEFAAAIASRRIEIIDLTQTLHPGTPVIGLPPPFAPTKPFAIEEISRYDERGPAWYWNNFSCSEHAAPISTRRSIGSPAGIWPMVRPIPSPYSA